MYTSTFNTTCKRKEVVHTVEVFVGVLRVVEEEVSHAREGSVVGSCCCRRDVSDCSRGRIREVLDVVLEQLGTGT